MQMQSKYIWRLFFVNTTDSSLFPWDWVDWIAVYNFAYPDLEFSSD